jgi:hypothetical protein
MRVPAASLLGLILIAGNVGIPARASEIGQALTRWSALADRDERFVIVEHAASGKFVQFEIEHDEIVIDLPVIALDEAERARAATVFASVDVDAPVEYRYQNEESGPELTIMTYRLGFGTDPEAAADFAARIVREVYLLPSHDGLVVTEGIR